MATFGHEDVRWFDVAMDNALGMRRIEPIGYFDGQGEQHLQLHRAFADHVLQRHPVEELHGNERLPVLLADVVDRADVRVIQRRRCLRLTLEAGQRLRVSGNLLRQELERHKTV